MALKFTYLYKKVFKKYLILVGMLADNVTSKVFMGVKFLFER